MLPSEEVAAMLPTVCPWLKREIQLDETYWKQRSALRGDEHINITGEFHLVVTKIVVHFLPGDHITQCSDIADTCNEQTEQMKRQDKRKKCQQLKDINQTVKTIWKSKTTETNQNREKSNTRRTTFKDKQNGKAQYYKIWTSRKIRNIKKLTLYE